MMLQPLYNLVAEVIGRRIFLPPDSKIWRGGAARAVGKFLLLIGLWRISQPTLLVHTMDCKRVFVYNMLSISLSFYAPVLHCNHIQHVVCCYHTRDQCGFTFCKLLMVNDNGKLLQLKLIVLGKMLILFLSVSSIRRSIALSWVWC